MELPGEAETAGGWFAGYQSPASGGREIARRIVVGSDRDEAERGNRKGKSHLQRTYHGDDGA